MSKYYDPLRDAQQEAPVGRCARCLGEIYAGERVYCFDGQEVCTDCLKQEVYDLLAHDTGLLAQLLGAEVVRYV